MYLSDIRYRMHLSDTRYRMQDPTIRCWIIKLFDILQPPGPNLSVNKQNKKLGNKMIRMCVYQIMCAVALRTRKNKINKTKSEE